VHVAQLQDTVQVWVPPIPQPCVAIGTHSPSPPQVPHSDHVPLSHVLVWVPQLPQPWLAGPAQV
jgi:hypothetical protein